MFYIYLAQENKMILNVNEEGDSWYTHIYIYWLIKAMLENILINSCFFMFIFLYKSINRIICKTWKNNGKIFGTKYIFSIEYLRTKCCLTGFLTKFCQTSVFIWTFYHFCVLIFILPPIIIINSTPNSILI